MEYFLLGVATIVGSLVIGCLIASVILIIRKSSCKGMSPGGVLDEQRSLEAGSKAP